MSAPIETDVLMLFGQLYEAEQQLAINTEREREATHKLRACTDDRKEAERQVQSIRERMQRLARRAAGVPELDRDDERRPGEGYMPVRTGRPL